VIEPMAIYADAIKSGGLSNEDAPFDTYPGADRNKNEDFDNKDVGSPQQFLGPFLAKRGLFRPNRRKLKGFLIPC
jgi:hypothetical protein